MRTVADKMRVRPGARALLVDAPDDVVASMRLPELVLDQPGELDHVHVFVRERAHLDGLLGRLRDRLAPRGSLWASWPKGGRLGTDLSLPTVIATAYARGLVESTTLRVDETWAAIRLTHPVPGRVYRNSYGRLPDERLDDDGAVLPASARSEA